MCLRVCMICISFSAYRLPACPLLFQTSDGRRPPLPDLIPSSIFRLDAARTNTQARTQVPPLITVSSRFVHRVTASIFPVQENERKERWTHRAHHSTRGNCVFSLAVPLYRFFFSCLPPGFLRLTHSKWLTRRGSQNSCPGLMLPSDGGFSTTNQTKAQNEMCC